MESPLEMAWVSQPQDEWKEVSGSLQCRANRVNQVDGDSRYGACLPASSVRGGLSKGTMVSASTSLWGKLPLHPRSEARQFDLSPYIPGAFQTAAPMLEFRGSES